MTVTDLRISDSELQVMQALWDDSPLSATEIAARLPPGRRWSLSTVKTLLARLVTKGAVASEADGRRFAYRPAVARDAVAARQAGNLLDRLFDGRVSPLVAHLAEQGALGDDDLAELERLVRSLRK